MSGVGRAELRGCGREDSCAACAVCAAAGRWRMLQLRGAPLPPLPPSAQERRAKLEASADDAHTPNDDSSSRVDKPSSRSLAEALSALMSMAPDATDNRGHQVQLPAPGTVKAGRHIGEPTAGTPANSSDEDTVRQSASSDEEGRGRQYCGRGPGTTPENGVMCGPGAIAPMSQTGARGHADLAAARPPVIDTVYDEFYRQSLEYLRTLPNGANLSAALLRRSHGMSAQLATLPDPKTRTFFVAPQTCSESERRARLVALVKYKRKREQQQLHPQVRYKSRKKIADNRVRHYSHAIASIPSPGRARATT